MKTHPFLALSAAAIALVACTTACGDHPTAGPADAAVGTTDASTVGPDGAAADGHAFDASAYDAEAPTSDGSSDSGKAAETGGTCVGATALCVTMPANGATVSGTVSIVGIAGSTWVNVAGYDAGGKKIAPDVSPSNGAFTLSLDSTLLPNGPATIQVTAFSAPAGQTGGTSDSVSLSLDVRNPTDGAVASDASPPTSKTRVGIANIAGWGLESLATSVGQVWDRSWTPDSGGDTTMIQTWVNNGGKFMFLYGPSNNNGVQGITPSTCASDIKTDAQFILGLTNKTTGVNAGLYEIEFGNEVYSNGSLPHDYVAQYVAAKSAIAGTGVKLGIPSTGAYAPGAGAYPWVAPDGWSDPTFAAPNQGGWNHDIIYELSLLGLPPTYVDAWIVHAYGPMTSVTLPYYSGWPGINKIYQWNVSLGSSAPIWVTEVGQDLTDVTEAQQATDMTQYLTNLLFADSAAAGTPYGTAAGGPVSIWLYYESHDDSEATNSAGQNWGILNSDNSPRPAWTAYAKFRATYASSIE